MDGNSHRARGLTPNSVEQAAPQQILVCKACKHQGEACIPGFDLLKKLREAIAKAGLADDFEVSGTACLAGCVPAHGQPCVVTRDGWMTRKDLPLRLCDTTLARSPAAMIVTREGAIQ